MQLRIPPLLMTALFASGMWGLARLLPGFVAPLPARIGASVFLVTAGASVAVLGVLTFRGAGTTVDPTRPGRAAVLVRHGVYRYSRNPMYLGLLVLLAGWAAWLAHWPAALVGLPLFVYVLNRFQIVPEEGALARLFGAEYDDYRREVRRWL